MNASPQCPPRCCSRPNSCPNPSPGPIPGSRKIFVEGSRPDLRVAMREIALSQTPTLFGGEDNPPLTVYDTSGAYTDPRRDDRPRRRPGAAARAVDRRARRHRGAAAACRSEFGRGREHDPQARRGALPGTARCRAWPGPAPTSPRCTTRAAASSRRRWNTSRSARTSAWTRSAMRMLLQQHPGESFGASIQKFITPGVRARRDRPRPRDHAQQHQPPGKRADDHRPQLPDQDQREHRQLARCRSGIAEEVEKLVWSIRWGGDTVMDLSHRQAHPRDARVDHPQLAGADRHRADLPGAGEGRRPRRGTDLGDLPRHADRAGRAGRGLLHHPRRRAAALRAADRQARHRHRLARRFDPGQVVPGAPQGEFPLHALRGHLRDHEGLRRRLLARRRPAPGLHRRRQRRRAVRRAGNARRADQDRLEARRPDHDRRPRPRADAADQGEHGQAAAPSAARRRSTRSGR